MLGIAVSLNPKDSHMKYFMLIIVCVTTSEIRAHSDWCLFWKNSRSLPAWCSIDPLVPEFEEGPGDSGLQWDMGIHGSWVAATYLCMEVLQLFINRIAILLRARWALFLEVGIILQTKTLYFREINLFKITQQIGGRARI